jgi:hypothetical protein
VAARYKVPLRRKVLDVHPERQRARVDRMGCSPAKVIRRAG